MMWAIAACRKKATLPQLRCLFLVTLILLIFMLIVFKCYFVSLIDDILCPLPTEMHSS